MAADRFDQVAQRWLNDENPNYGLENFQPDDIVVSFMEGAQLPRLEGWSLQRYFTVLKSKAEVGPFLESLNLIPSKLYKDSALTWLWDQWSTMPSSLRKIYVRPEVLAMPDPHINPMPTIRGAEVSLVVEDEVVAPEVPATTQRAYILLFNGAVAGLTLDAQEADNWLCEDHKCSKQAVPLLDRVAYLLQDADGKPLGVTLSHSVAESHEECASFMMIALE